jgi:hypothetical protein
MRQRSQAQRPRRALPLDSNSNQRTAKARTNEEKPVACKKKGCWLCFAFSSDQGANAAPREKKNRFC